MFDDLVIANDGTFRRESQPVSAITLIVCVIRYLILINCPSSDVVVEFSVLFPCSHKHKTDAAVNMEKKPHIGLICSR